MAMALLAPCGAPCSSNAISTTGGWRGTRSLYIHTGILGWNTRTRQSQVITWKCAVDRDTSLASSEEPTGVGVSSLTAEEEEEEEDEAEGSSVSPDGRLADGADAKTIVEWQLDFCSRPIFDDRGKKMWELILCDSKRQLEFARFYPNNVINSATLKSAILEVIETFGLPRPSKVRFFRSQVKTIISKACKELDIQPVPSLRCTALIRWLQERYDKVYRQHPGFQDGASVSSIPDVSFPKPVPENLRGEKWAFVQLPFGVLQEEMKVVEKGSAFGNVYLDLAELPAPDTLIPGVAVASSRALPLAAWTNSMELASLDVDKRKSCLILSSGASQRYFYAYYTKSKQADEEADAWEEAKKACGGLHFLAIQPSLDSDSCSGLWLLYEFPTSPV